MADKVAGFLEVGLNDNGEIAINHAVEVDENGIGHFNFSPNQARNLARLLIKNADELDPGGAVVFLSRPQLDWLRKQIFEQKGYPIDQILDPVEDAVKSINDPITSAISIFEGKAGDLRGLVDNLQQADAEWDIVEIIEPGLTIPREKAVAYYGYTLERDIQAAMLPKPFRRVVRGYKGTGRIDVVNFDEE